MQAVCTLAMDAAEPAPTSRRQGSMVSSEPLIPVRICHAAHHNPRRCTYALHTAPSFSTDRAACCEGCAPPHEGLPAHCVAKTAEGHIEDEGGQGRGRDDHSHTYQ